jgi:hypothetical protein
MMLEEAGAETVGTVIATLKPSNQGEFSAQVDGLVSLGFIRKEKNNLILTEQGRIAFKAWVAGSSPAALTISFQVLGCSGGRYRSRLVDD